MKKSLLIRVQQSISNPRELLAVLSMILLGSCGGPKRADDEAVVRFKQWFHDFYLAAENHMNLEPYVENYYIDWLKFDNNPNYNPYYDLYDVDYESHLVMYRAGGQEEFVRAMEWFNTNFGLPEDIIIHEATYWKRVSSTGHYVFELEVRRQFANTKEEYVFGISDDGFKVKMIYFLEAKLDNEDEVSVDRGIGVSLKEGSLILPDKTQISIGDSFESLEFLSPRFLYSSPRWDSYFLTDSSSIGISIDHESENITSIRVYLYSIYDAWTEIKKVGVEGRKGTIKINRGMKREELIDILEELGIRYELDWSVAATTVKVNLTNFHKASFRFLDEINGELDRVLCWEETLCQHR